MDRTVLVDSDVLVDVARGHAESIRQLAQLEETAALAISVVTEMELVVGCRNKDELSGLHHFLRRFVRIPLKPEVGVSAVKLLEQYRLSQGLLIPDALIAATALVEDLPLVTRNARHYRHVPGLRVTTP
jgi:hypothetical protein